MKNNRLIWADSLKGLLIILVVLGHAIQRTLGIACETNHLWNMIYSFHMPAFMAVSGYLAYRTNRGGQILPLIIRRFKQLVVPFFLWTLVLLFVNGRFCIEALVNAILYPDGGLWFLWVLFIINVLFVLGDALSVKFKIKQEIMIGAVGLLLATLMVFLEIRLLGFQFISYYFIWYSVGYFLHKHQEKILSGNSVVIICLVVLWSVMAWFWQMQEVPYFLKRIPLPQTLLLYTYRFSTALVAIYVLFAVTPRLLNCADGWNKPFVELGKVSLGIYTVHVIMIKWIVDYFKGVVHDDAFVIALSFFVAMSLSWTIVWILSKWKITEKMLLGKV